MPGVEIGRRHDPLGILPPDRQGRLRYLDFIVGGRPLAGQNSACSWTTWRQDAPSRALPLRRRLQLAARAASATPGPAPVRHVHQALRGIEALARIASMTCLMNAARVVTAGAVDAGQSPPSSRPSWPTAPGMRTVINDAMDVQAVTPLGPLRFDQSYCAVPGITVEAPTSDPLHDHLRAGAIRCHPFAKEEMAAVAATTWPASTRLLQRELRLPQRRACPGQVWRPR